MLALVLLELCWIKSEVEALIQVEGIVSMPIKVHLEEVLKVSYSP